MRFFQLSCFLTAVAIALNALGKHILSSVLLDTQVFLFDTATRYLLFGSLWIMVLTRPASKLPIGPIWVIFSGLCLFSGALFFYLLFPFKVFMLITPLGGITLIIGFIMMAYQTRDL